GDDLRPLLEDERAVEVPLVVDPVLDLPAVLVALPLLRPPADQVLVEVDADHLVRGQETVLDPLLEGVDVDRLAEVLDVGDVASLLGRRRETEVDRRGEVLQYLAPGRVLGGAPAVALVDDDEVEEVRRELLVDVLLLLGPRDRLV